MSQCTRLTDGRTDGRTDRRTDRIPIARLRLHSMQRGKNRKERKKKSLWVKLKAFQTNVGRPNSNTDSRQNNVISHIQLSTRNMANLLPIFRASGKRKVVKTLNPKPFSASTLASRKLHDPYLSYGSCSLYEIAAIYIIDSIYNFVAPNNNTKNASVLLKFEDFNVSSENLENL